MAATRLIKLISATLLCVGATSWVHGAEQLTQSKGPISLSADSNEVDFKTGKTLLRNVTISQGDVSIKAARAEGTGMNFDDSRWEFNGDVKIVSEKRGTLSSDRAVVEFHNNRIIRATVDGKPAEFEQKGAVQTGKAGTIDTARGRARQIVYEVEAGTVRFTTDAWLSNGANEISGPVLVYNIRQEKVMGTTSPGGGQRVQITIVPKDGSKPAVKPQPAPPPDGEAKP